MATDAPGQTRTQRRVQRTRTAIEAAFIRLAAERGDGNITMEDIAEAADVAKATLYAHYPNREALLTALFARLTSELAERVVYREGPWDEVRTGAMTAVYEHAAEMCDLYRVCLAEPATRALYLDGVAAYAEDNFRMRIAALGREPRMPIDVSARAFAGAHVALLEAWLATGLQRTPQEMATMELDILVAGIRWANGFTPGESSSEQRPSLDGD
jgi:AcrR family transcriptional regulator